ncbi:Uncharacterised protein [Mycobacteroides abscessus subsp. abscessus]|nr:Uncharacterised protein [Mycobacteroides abscessus subsp. abscessus]
MCFEKLVDISQFGFASATHHQVKIVVGGYPPRWPGNELPDIQVVVLIALVAGVEMKDIRSQS